MKTNYNIIKTLFNATLAEAVKYFPVLTVNHITVKIADDMPARTLGVTQKNCTNDYTISLNQYYVQLSDENAVKNTLMHEILHTLPGAMCHTGVWKKAANLINWQYPQYHISRVNREINEYSKYISQQQKLNAKYIIECSQCNTQWHYQRKSKTIQALALGRTNYLCPHCKTIVKLLKY